MRMGHPPSRSARSGRPLATYPADQIVVGRFGDDFGEEVVARRCGDAAVELHCHGGRAAVARIEESTKNRRTAIYVRRKELLDEASLMLMPHTVAPGATAGGIVKLDPAHVSRGQPLKLVVSVGGETHEFVFRAGG